MPNVKISNVKRETLYVKCHNMKIRQMSKYGNLVCQAPRGYWLAWEAAYVVRYESYDLIVKRQTWTLYVKSQNMKITLRSAIPCRSQNVTPIPIRHLTNVVY